ncbi:MAG TPA: MBG domain-containing protein, partial [Flavobacterium sp.]|uniref:MBG domain-containing protein n=1 Tax=Flavobacterium sp. TaxID=239 RepID=UPI002DC01AB0
NLFFANVSFGQATVITDKDDYAPGSTAIINGSGFQAGEVVELHVEHADGDPLGTDPGFHEPWFVTADSAGSFNSSWYVPTVVEGDAYGATLLLTAHGSLGSVADWLFTDAGNFTYLTTLGKSNTISAIANTTNSNTLSVDVTAPKNNGTFSASLAFVVQSGTTIGIGNGANQINLTSVINNYITGGPSGSDITKTFAITVAVGSSVPDGTYQFQATAISTSGNPANNKEWKFDVIVGSVPGSIGTVTVGTQSGVSVYGTVSSPTFDVTSLRGANGLVNGTYSVSGLPSGVTYNFAPSSTFIANGITAFPGATLTLNAPASLNAGLYNFTVSLSDGISTVAAVGTLTVTPRPITITANSRSKTYGDAVTFAGTEFSTPVGSLVNGDAISSVTLASTGAGASATVTAPGPTYPIVASAAIGSGLGNYNISYATGVLTVGVKSITVTADNRSKTYGDAVTFAGTEFTTVGLVNSDTVTSATISSTGSAATAAVGTYDILIGSAVGSGLSNYDITYTKKTLTVGKKGLEVFAVDQTKTYGDAVTFAGTEFTTVGLVNSDTVTSATISSTGSAATAAVGTYDILIGSAVGSGLPNYDITYTKKTLTVGKKTISIKADDKSKFCGQANPDFTFTVTGFVNNETKSVLNVPPVVKLDTNGITIIASGCSDNNYEVTNYESGTLTIQGVNIDASASSLVIQLNSSTAPLKATVKSSLDGNPVSNVNVTFKLFNGSNQVGPSETVLTTDNGEASLSLIISSLPMGLYKVEAISGSDCSSSAAYMTIYDPNGSFVTGGGWINSPAGALVGQSLTGKANFGFNAKYKKGNNQVEGNTEFQFQTGNFNFKSNLLNAGTLVISGAKATYRGVGTVNGSGNYGFMVSAIDGQILGGGGVDKFRIKIWNIANGNTVVYDNQMNVDENLAATTELGGGSIVIHEVKKNTTKIAQKASVTTLEILQFNITAYPNPSKNYFSLNLTGGSTEKVEIDIFDMQGRKVKHIESANQDSIVFGEELPVGNYIAVVNQGANRKTIKLLKE